jgi:hypothetical protein
MDNTQTDSIKKLEELSKGVGEINSRSELPVEEDLTNKVVIDGKKISNMMLRRFVEKLDGEKVEAPMILKLIIDMDDGVEKGEITNKMFKDFLLSRNK